MQISQRRRAAFSNVQTQEIIRQWEFRQRGQCSLLAELRGFTQDPLSLGHCEDFFIFILRDIRTLASRTAANMQVLL